MKAKNQTAIRPKKSDHRLALEILVAGGSAAALMLGMGEITSDLAQYTAESNPILTTLNQYAAAGFSGLGLLWGSVAIVGNSYYAHRDSFLKQ